MEYYKEVLINDFQIRKKRNPAFSIRSYSRFLGVPQATISEVLRNRRSLPKKYAYIDHIHAF